MPEENYLVRIRSDAKAWRHSEIGQKNLTIYAIPWIKIRKKWNCFLLRLELMTSALSVQCLFIVLNFKTYMGVTLLTQVWKITRTRSMGDNFSPVQNFQKSEICFCRTSPNISNVTIDLIGCPQWQANTKSLFFHTYF